MKTSSLISLGLCVALATSCSKDEDGKEQAPSPQTPTPKVCYSDFLQLDDCGKLTFDIWEVVSREVDFPHQYGTIPMGPYWESRFPIIQVHGGRNPTGITDSLDFRDNSTLLHHSTNFSYGHLDSMKLNLSCDTLVSGAKAYLTMAANGQPLEYEYCELLEFNDTTATLQFVSRVYFHTKHHEQLHFRFEEKVDLKLNTRLLDLNK